VQAHASETNAFVAFARSRARARSVRRWWSIEGFGIGAALDTSADVPAVEAV